MTTAWMLGDVRAAERDASSVYPRRSLCDKLEKMGGNKGTVRNVVMSRSWTGGRGRETKG